MEAQAEAVKPTRRWGGFVWQVLKERPAAAVGAFIVIVFVAVGVLAPYIAPYGLHQQVGPVFGRPSAKHWRGLDDGGIDMVTLLMWGARISLLVGFAGAPLSFVVRGVGRVGGGAPGRRGG